MPTFTNLNTDKAELSGAAFTGAITTNSTIDGRDVATDGTKLDGIEASADVTDTANVTSAGALMDSELTSIASVKALNQGVATTDSPTFADVVAASLDISGDIDVDGTTNLDVVDIDGALTQDGGAVFNEASADVDFRVESNGNANMLFVDGGANKVGIGRDPQDNGSTLQVAADATASTDLQLALRGLSNENKKLLLGFDTTSNIASITSFEAGVTHRPLHLQGSEFVWNESGSDHDFRVESNGNANMLFVDGGNNKVGIGTSSPSSLLHVNNTADSANGITIQNSSASGSADAYLQFTSSASAVRMGIDATGTDAFKISNGTALGTNDVLVIDSSGRVGIGTSSPAFVLDVNHASDNGLARFTSGDADAYITIGDVNSTSAHNKIGVITHDMYFNTNGSERMRIDSSGNVGISTSDPKSALEVKGTFGAPATSGSAAGFISRFSQTSGVGSLDFGFGDPYSWIQSRRSDDYATNFDLALQPNGGSVGIGTTSPSSSISSSSTVLEIADSNVASLALNNTTQSTKFEIASIDVSGGALSIRDNNAERMRIDSSGTLLLRHSSESDNVALSVGGGSGVARVIPAVDNQGYIGQSNRRWQAIYAVDGSIETSDEREKTEIKPTTLGLDFIKDLKPVSYKWIDAEQQNKGKDKREHQGLIAQQVAETVEKYGIDKNSFGGLDIQKTDKYNDFHGMTYSQLIAPLIKAIQEQQTLIESLTARIAALEE